MPYSKFIEEKLAKFESNLEKQVDDDFPVYLLEKLIKIGKKELRQSLTAQLEWIEKEIIDAERAYKVTCPCEECNFKEAILDFKTLFEKEIKN